MNSTPGSWWDGGSGVAVLLIDEHGRVAEACEWLTRRFSERNQALVGRVAEDAERELREAVRSSRDARTADGMVSELGEVRHVALHGGRRLIVASTGLCPSDSEVGAERARTPAGEVTLGGAKLTVLSSPARSASTIRSPDERGRVELGYGPSGYTQLGIPSRRDILQALEAGEFTLSYQPIVDRVSKELTGVEGLARWCRGGVEVPPDRFIPHVERLGLASRFFLYMLQRCGAEWQDICTSDREFRVALNLSPFQLHDRQSCHDLMECVGAVGEFAQHLELEITESAFVQPEEYVIRSIELLRMMDVRVALDDFGTGCSTLSTLVALPLDRLKLDRSFLETALQRPRAKNVLEGIVKIARELQLRVVAEGVETARHEALACDIDCDELQGFYYGRPMSCRQIVDRL